MKVNRFFTNLMFAFMKVTGYIPALIFFAPKIYYKNKENQGRRLKGACILMSNHTAFLDYVLYLVVFVGRTMNFWMAEVLFEKNKVLNWFLYTIGGIRINRDSYDFRFIRQSVNVLKKGGVIGVFPQGRLPVDGEIFPYKPGIVLVAMRMNVPIIPIYTDGVYKLNKRTRMVIGEKIYLREKFHIENPNKVSKEKIEEMAAYLQEENYKLKDYLEECMKNEKH